MPQSQLSSHAHLSVVQTLCLTFQAWISSTARRRHRACPGQESALITTDWTSRAAQRGIITRRAWRVRRAAATRVGLTSGPVACSMAACVSPPSVLWVDCTAMSAPSRVVVLRAGCKTDVLRGTRWCVHAVRWSSQPAAAQTRSGLQDGAIMRCDASPQPAATRTCSGSQDGVSMLCDASSKWAAEKRVHGRVRCAAMLCDEPPIAMAVLKSEDPHQVCGTLHASATA